MANGKPGDDWFTDVVAHGLPTFSVEADQLISEIAAMCAEPRPNELVSFVDGFLAKVGYDELASRGTTIGMEYRKLRPDELRHLERVLRELRGRLGRSE
jgi:hypothetical protein